MKVVEPTSKICNLPKLLDWSKSDSNDNFVMENARGVTFGNVTFCVDVIKKSNVYHIGKSDVHLIDVLVELGEKYECSQGNHHTGHIDTWYQTDFKYYFLDGDKKVYLKSIVNSPRQDEFIVVDYLSKA